MQVGNIIRNLKKATTTKKTINLKKTKQKTKNTQSKSDLK